MQSHRAPRPERDSTTGILILCDCHLEILNDFTFEFVLCKWSPVGMWDVCGSWCIG